jgi:hypothetical protein
MANVYIAYDADDKVLYVGVTKRQITRIDEHRERSAWWPLVRRLEIEHYPTPADAAMRESELIRTLQPPFNVKGTASRAGVKTARRAAQRACEAELPPAAPEWPDSDSRDAHRGPNEHLVSLPCDAPAWHDFGSRGGCRGRHFRLKSCHSTESPP